MIMVNATRVLRRQPQRLLNNTSRQLSTRALSLTGKRSVGFQSSDFSSPETDAILLERSLRMGCQVFVSSAGRSAVHLERLAELSNVDDVDLDELVIGNRISSVAHADAETEIAVESLCGRSLDFSTVPLILEGVLQAPAGGDFRGIEAALLALQNSEEGEVAGAVGVELSTSLLRQCIVNPTHTTSMPFENIKLSSSSTYTVNELLATLDRLHRKGLLSVVLCACNVFTLPVALAVNRWATERPGVSFLGTETLRGHPRSPGLLVEPSSANAGIGSLPDMPMSEAIEMFKKNLNTCIHFEKNFLDKVRHAHGKEGSSRDDLPMAFPPVTSLCVGMVLAQTQHSLLFPQDWAAIRDKQVEPNFEKACKALREHAGDNEAVEYENFLTVYVPMKRNLLRAFDATLNARQVLLCEELKASSEKSFPDILRVVADRSCDARYCYSGMALHECVTKAWMGVLSSSAAGPEEDRGEGSTALFVHGVEVPAEMWEDSKIGHHDLSKSTIQEASMAYLTTIAEILDKEFYANNED